MAFIEEYVYIFQVIDKDDITLYNQVAVQHEN